MADDKDDKKDYDVGYGKPPKQHQFKKGQSGNPRGRPKDSRNLKQVLMEVAQEELPITENGQLRVVSRKEALVRTLFAKALKGDLRATKQLTDLWAKYSGLFER